MILREYQTQAIRDLRQSIAAGNRAPLLVAPTGSGKTAIAAELIHRARSKGHQALMLAPRRELVYQAQERIESMGMDYGVIMAGEQPSLLPSVQIASVATLHERAIKRGAIKMPSAGLVLCDEAHEGTFGESKDILDYYRERGAVIVGLTATPARPSDGRGLGEVYDDMIQAPTTPELIEMGYLVPVRHFRGESPDLEGVKVSGKGEYVQKQLDEPVREPKLIGSVVANWFRLASDRQTFVFAHNVAHSRQLCDEFHAQGVAAEHIDGNTPLDKRKAIHDRLVSGETQVLCNCEVYTYGVDFPPVSCIVLAKPTKSIVRFLQMAGRGLRTAPGKRDCYLLDHARATQDCGFVDEVQPWTLDGKKKIQDERKQKSRSEPKPLTCPDCQCEFQAASECPNCGRPMHQEKRKALEELEAELVEIDRRDKTKRNREWSQDEKAAFFGELKGYAKSKGYKIGWAVHAYKDRLGVLPWPVYHTETRIPGPETRAWITSRNIRNAKRRENQRAEA